MTQQPNFLFLAVSKKRIIRSDASLTFNLFSMKIKKILFSGLLILGITACINDDSEGPITKPSELKIVVQIPGMEDGNKTRGVIEDPVSDLNPIIESATVYVMKGTGLDFIDKKTIVFGENKYNDAYAVTFEAIPLSGNERVVVTGNLGKETSPVNMKVQQIQPTTEKAGLTNICYRGEEPIKKSQKPGNDDGHAVYEAAVTVEALAARVEMTNNIKYNEDLVKDLFVDVVSPTEYSNTLGSMVKFIPKSSDNGDLWLGLDATQYGSIAKGKAVANHLFVGDIQKITFRINATIYEYEMDVNGKAIKITEASRNIDSYSYTDGIKKYVKDADGKYFAYEMNNVNSIIIDTDEATKITLKTYNTIDANSGFFTLANFSSSESEYKEVDGGVYKGGVIYRIQLDKIDWNGNKQIDSGDIYDPNEKGIGSPEPAESADLIVFAEILPWTEKNVFPGVE